METGQHWQSQREEGGENHNSWISLTVEEFVQMLGSIIPHIHINMYLNLPKSKY